MDDTPKSSEGFDKKSSNYAWRYEYDSRVEQVLLTIQNMLRKLQIEFEDNKGVFITSTIEGSLIDDFNFVSVLTYFPNESLNGKDLMAQQLHKEDQSAEFATLIGRTSEDGYNWREYDQKQVECSEFPQCYSECTYPSCRVKKKIEHSLKGDITDIIYEGPHRHPKPQPTHSSGFSSSYSIELSTSAIGLEATINVEEESISTGSQQESNDKNAVNWNTAMERASPTSDFTEFSDALSTAKEKCSKVPMKHPVTQANEAEQDDDDDGNKSELKRRKEESYFVDSNTICGAREPRVVIQTVSDVDILDDGYRWRKYGQKVVKGNPNPRSYYKCTYPTCSVRKLIERASHDLKSVITTYEGKHNHDVPKPNAGGKPQNTPTAQSSITSKLKESQNIFPSFHENLEFPSNRGNATFDLSRAFPSYDMLQSLSFGSVASRFHCKEPTLPHPPSNLNFSSPFQMSVPRPGTAFYDYKVYDLSRPNASEVHFLLGQQQSMEDGTSSQHDSCTERGL
ncbi:hypothetical protein ZIOFF_021027 [Zingiber officinale]|uniref:WRKY domain-containing protein n=1 Tax=Zingiber officinale TaxID=94328 RepID=A0A8J5GZP1_ZINOF|nr:hypothetical protein ZIOFF_021027 [Zingiber officinale]